MPYKVTVGDESWLTDDLTLDETIAIERSTGRSWAQLNPFASGEDCKAIIVAFLSRTLDPEVAAKQVGTMRLGDVLASVKEVRDDLPDYYEDGIPKAGGATATSGSSGAPADSAGPPT